MIPSTSTSTRFPRKSASSEHSCIDLSLRTCLGTPETHSQLLSLSKGPLRNLASSGSPNHEHRNTCYPSPPSTDPRFEEHIPLPSLIDLDSLKCSSGHISGDFYILSGTLDSPPILLRSFSRFQAPLSPPMTVPTSSASLPVAEGSLTSPSDEARELSDYDDMSVSSSPALTPSSRSSCSTLQSPPPLSPISPNFPEWLPQSFGSPHVSPDSGFHRGISSDGLPFSIGGHNERSLLKSDFLSRSYPLSLLSIQQPDNSDVVPGPFYRNRICDSPPPMEEHLEPIGLDDQAFFTTPFSETGQVEEPDLPMDEETFTDCSHEADLATQHHQAETQNVDSLPVPPTFHHTFSPSTRNSSLPELDDLTEFDLDLLVPSSPSRRSYSALPSDEHGISIPPAEAERIDDVVMESPPDSPALSLLSLPGGQLDDDLLPMDLASPKSSEALSPLLSSRLLDIDDSSPESSSNRRSLSPEPCSILDTNFLETQLSGDEELKGVCRLMKKTKDKERIARNMESLFEDEERRTREISEGSPAALAATDQLIDARRKTRKAKEKVREVATLLRLKLAQRGWKLEQDTTGNPVLTPLSPSIPTSTETPSSEKEDPEKSDPRPPTPTGHLPKRLRITNPQQLVVKMVMDRHEPRSSTPSVRAGFPSRRTKPSPLTRGSITAKDLETQEGHDEMSIGEDEGKLIPDNVAIPDIAMGNVDDGKDGDLMDELDLNMESLRGFS